VENRLLFMAAIYSPDNDVDAWTEFVLEQVTSARFAKHLKHNLLIELYDNVSKNKDNTGKLTRVLKMIPRATMLAASQREIKAQKAAERDRALQRLASAFTWRAM
jgi:hypothetical protein